MCPVKIGMPKIIQTRQGQAWDQLSRTAYGAEKLMHHMQNVNPDEADALLFSGNVPMAVPPVDAGTRQVTVNLLPPWERF